MKTAFSGAPAGAPFLFPTCFLPQRIPRVDSMRFSTVLLASHPFFQSPGDSRRMAALTSADVWAILSPG